MSRVTTGMPAAGSRWRRLRAALGAEVSPAPTGDGTGEGEDGAPSTPWAHVPTLVLTLAGIVVLFYVLDRLIWSGAALPVGAYEEPVMELKALTSPEFVTRALVPASLPFLWWRRLGWKRLDAPPGLRLLVIVPVAVLAWAFATYEVNVYFDQAHVGSRLILVALAALVWVHPAFVGPFVVEATMVASQFGHPLGMYTWTDKRVVFQACVLFVAVLVLVRWFRGAARLYPFVLTTLVGAWVFLPGVGKLLTGWLWRDDVSNLFVSSWSYGWFGGLGEDTVLRVADVLRAVNPAVVVATMAIELSPVAVLLRRRLTPFVLGGFIVFHLTIFASSGIFFWKWIVLESALIWWYLRRRERGTDDDAWPVRRAVASVVLVVTGAAWWAQATNLAWFDSNYTQRFALEVVGDSGRTYTVSAGFMGPYDVTFSQDRFFFLAGRPVVVGTYGAVTDHGSLRALLDADDLDDVAEVEAALGRDAGSARSRAKLDLFLRRFFSNLNARGGKTAVPDLLAAPHHIWTAGSGHAYAFQEPVAKVRVVEVRTLYRPGHPLESARRTVDTVTIPRGEAG